MNSSDQAPKVPLWVFFATDFALLAAAAFVAANSARPLESGAILAIVACVITGALVALVPLVLWFERQKNEALDDRQRALEALATTVSNSAEQIGIATAGLQEISESVQKNLRHAEQLPHRLQEKIAEFQAQLANATDGEKEELEKEVAALRETETERLESVSDRLSRAVAEFAKLEATTHQHLSAASEAVGKLSLGTASAIGKAQAAAEQALGHARLEASRHLAEHAAQQTKSFEAARAAALAAFDAQITAAGQALADRLSREINSAVGPALGALDAKIARLEAMAHAPAAPAAPASVTPTPPPPPPSIVAQPPAGGPTEAPAATAPLPPASTPPPAAGAVHDEAVASAPKRTRKPRREETAPGVVAVAAAPSEAGAASEPPPVLVHQIPEVAPVAPDTAEPFTLISEPLHPASGNGTGKGRPAAGGEKRPKDNSGRREAPAAQAGADETEESTRSADRNGTSEVLESVLTSDGATRLVVTAYIGIGNRLFIRGDGPGLSWERGVPLQFVSIGKWRWETNDATRPIRFKLLKNDEQECGGLGAQTLDPGHQQEVTASF